MSQFLKINVHLHVCICVLSASNNPNTSDILMSLLLKMIYRAGDLAQQYSICLASTRPWVWSPVQKKSYTMRPTQQIFLSSGSQKPKIRLPSGLGYWWDTSSQVTEDSCILTLKKVNKPSNLLKGTDPIWGALHLWPSCLPRTPCRDLILVYEFRRDTHLVHISTVPKGYSPLRIWYM